MDLQGAAYPPWETPGRGQGRGSRHSSTKAGAASGAGSVLDPGYQGPSVYLVPHTCSKGWWGEFPHRPQLYPTAFGAAALLLLAYRALGRCCMGPCSNLQRKLLSARTGFAHGPHEGPQVLIPQGGQGWGMVHLLQADAEAQAVPGRPGLRRDRQQVSSRATWLPCASGFAQVLVL